MNEQTGSRESILIVDDEPVNLRLLEKLLNGRGYMNLTLIQDPREAVPAYEKVRPDLILLDINMQHLDGYQVMAKLNELNDPLLPPVVILSAQHTREFMLRALNIGARDFLSKPFDSVELIMRVRNLLDAHLAHRLVHDQKLVLEEMVAAQTEEVRRTRLQVVQRLGKAAEFRDEETGNHILRMSNYSAFLARLAGWSVAECELMLHASPMHDIGKIAIPDSILLKPGKLDPDEWAVMQTHTTLGAQMLGEDESDLMNMAREIALTHHEKWDGSGYPSCLSGSAIPLSGRIVALADVFDALTSGRPYKKAWSIEAAVDMIQANSGVHFDPRLVELFVANLEEIRDIRMRCLDSKASV